MNYSAIGAYHEMTLHVYWNVYAGCDRILKKITCNEYVKFIIGTVVIVKQIKDHAHHL